jgi:hypothetical protein
MYLSLAFGSKHPAAQFLTAYRQDEQRLSYIRMRSAFPNANPVDLVSIRPNRGGVCTLELTMPREWMKLWTNQLLIWYPCTHTHARGRSHIVSHCLSVL